MLELVLSGLDWVLAAQSLGSWLTVPMRLVSQLGTEPFYLLIMPMVLWCYDYTLGFRLALILSASAFSNSMLKLVFALPRPFWVSGAVRPLSFETSFGMPSGHSQNAVSIWGRLGFGIGRRWALLSALGLILAISFSRIYLGVHFPLDVLGGWLVGGVLLLVFLTLERPVWHWFRSKNEVVQLILILLAALVPLYAGLLIWANSMTLPLPAAWMASASAAAPTGEQLADPRAFEGFVSLAAVSLGLMLGAWQLQRQGGFQADGSTVQKTVRFALGAFGVALLFFGLDQVGVPQDQLVGQLWRFLRYGVVGYWIAFLAPRLFFSLNLAERKQPPTNGSD